jgi:hypothetical protein
MTDDLLVMLKDAEDFFAELEGDLGSTRLNARAADAGHS